MAETTKPRRLKGTSVRQKAEATASKPVKTRRFRRSKKADSAAKVDKKPGISRFFIPSYFRNSWRELKQVTWPGRRETIKLTFAVVVFALVFAALIGFVDLGLDKIFKRILL